MLIASALTHPEYSQGRFGERELLKSDTECTECTAGSWCNSEGRVDVQGKFQLSQICAIVISSLKMTDPCELSINLLFFCNQFCVKI